MVDPGKIVFLEPVQGLTEFDLLEDLGSAGLRLPVAPMDRFNRTLAAGFTSANVVNLGEVISHQGARLSTVTFQSILPDYDHFEGDSVILPVWAHQPTNQFPFEDPRVISNMLYRMTKLGVVFRLLITRPNATGGPITSNRDVDINMFAVIDNYEDWEEDGSDVWYNISFKQWRPVNVKKVTRSSTTGTARTTVTRPGQAKIPATYKIVKGDTLPSIALRFFKDSRRWRDIAALNGILHPNNIKVGQILKMPKK